MGALITETLQIQMHITEIQFHFIITGFIILYIR